jgi:RNA polymerase sigma-70 factor, ECF subfamily
MGDFTVDGKLLQVDGENWRSRMPNPSSDATLNRRASVGAAAKPLPVLRARRGSARSGSRKPVSCEPNHPVETQPEIPTTETFHEMFVTSRRKFVATAYSILRNIEDAEDAVQNAYISAYLHLRNFEGRSALKTWFTRVVLNAALMIHRKRRTAQLASAPEWPPEESTKCMDSIPSPEPDPEMSLGKTEKLALIEGLATHLKPRLREAFSTFYGNDMTVPEARDVLGLSTSTFKARLFRARRQVMREAKRALALRPQKRMSHGFSSAVS